MKIHGKTPQKNIIDVNINSILSANKLQTTKKIEDFMYVKALEQTHKNFQEQLR